MALYEKIVVVTRKTRLEELIARFNSRGQAKFYIEHAGGDFSDYESEDASYQAAIAEARSVYEARVAERKIMHQAALRKTFDPAERQALDEELRRDLDRFEAERESKVRKIRGE